MAPATSEAAVAVEPASGGRVALWVLVVQCLLALSWTLYVLFLPGLLATAGIERRWFVYVLIVDQLVFAACDWAAGVYVDRIATAWKRTGRAITAITLLSSAALLAMPWVAERGNATLLLVVILVWAATSSALRAPVFALLGRVRESAAAPVRPDLIGRAGAVSLALVGISLAGAIGPYVTMLLKGVDGRLPIAASAVSLAVAGLWATRVEERLPVLDPEPADVPLVRRRAWVLAAAVLIATSGTQVVTAVLAPPLFQRLVGSAAGLWTAWFWIGFAIGLVPGARLASSGVTRGRPWRKAGLALVGAAAVFVLVSATAALASLAAGIAAIGIAWGIFTTIAFSSAVSLSGGRATAGGAGTASGMLFSAVAIGTLLRLALVAAGWSRAEVVAWLPAIAWVVASALLIGFARRLWRDEPG